MRLENFKVRYYQYLYSNGKKSEVYHGSYDDYNRLIPFNITADLDNFIMSINTELYFKVTDTMSILLGVDKDVFEYIRYYIQYKEPQNKEE